MRIALAMLAVAVVMTGCGPSHDFRVRNAPEILRQSGYTNIKLESPGMMMGGGCPRNFAGIGGTAEQNGQLFQVAVCWNGQRVAVVREPVSGR